MEFVALVVSLLTIFTIFVDYRWKPKHGHVLPYRVPVIGHLFSLLYHGKNIHKTPTYWAEKYNWDVYTLQIFNMKITVFNSYEANYEALVTKGKEFGGKPKTFRINYIFKQKDIAMADVSPRWRKLHNIVHYNIKQYGEGMNRIDRIVHEIAQDLVEAIKTNSMHTDGIYCPHIDIDLAFVNNITLIVTGQKYDHMDPVFNKWQTVIRLMSERIFCYSHGWELDVFPWLQHFGHPPLRDIDRYESLTKELLADLKKEFDNVKTRKTKEEIAVLGIAHSLFHYMETSGDDLLDDDIIRLVVLDLMLAGKVSSSEHFSAFLNIIAEHPEIQGKMYAEIVKITKENGTEYISLFDRGKMPYTEACILELLRYVTLSPFNAHVALSNCSVQGTLVEEGNIVLYNNWYLHHTPSYWDKPWQFMPERFLDDDGALVLADHINRKRVLAFGAGIRACIGQILAKARLFIFMTKMIQEFDIRGVPESGDEAYYDPRNCEYVAVVLPKKKSLKFIPRKQT